MPEHPNSQRAYKVLIADPVGLKPNAHGQPDISELRTRIEALGGVLHLGSIDSSTSLSPGKVHVFYQPGLSREEEILAQTDFGSIRRFDRSGDLHSRRNRLPRMRCASVPARATWGAVPGAVVAARAGRRP